MITTQQEFINVLPLFYTQLHMPIFLLSESLAILYSPDHFFKLEPDYFQNSVSQTDIQAYKVYTYFYHNETYFFFYYPLKDISYVCIGPYFPKKISHQEHPSDYHFIQHVISNYSLQDFFELPYATKDIGRELIFAYQLITGKTLEMNELKLNFQLPSSHPLKEEKDLDEELFQIRENPLHEFSYSYEQKILNYIQNENSTSARILITELMQIKDDRHLSANQLQSVKYKLVAAITLFTRGVIDVGVPIAKAYTLSDVYIGKTDRCQNMNELHKIITDGIVDFTQLVKRYKNIQNPHWVKLCKNYISHHLHRNISLKELAEVVDMNPSYLSTQFKKITGQSLKQYINEQKIKEAMFLIKTSHYSMAEIADILQFSSQSHFHKVFKEITGQSPLQYKNKK